MVTEGYTATLVAATLAISRSSLYYRKKPRGSRADRTYDEQIVVACGGKLAYGYRRVAGGGLGEKRLRGDTQRGVLGVGGRGVFVWRPPLIPRREKNGWRGGSPSA